MSDESIVDLIRKHQDQGDVDPNMPEANRGAVAQKAQALAESVPVDVQSEEVLQRLLANVVAKQTWVEIDLPSRGLLYQDGAAKLQIRPLSFEDERSLKSASASKDPDGIIEKLLRDCTRGVDSSEMTPQDKMYALFRIRGISYGDSYPIEHDCVKCGSTSKLELSIKTLDTTALKEEHMRFTLPDSQQEVQIKLPRTQDANLYATLDAMHQNMHMFVYSVGGVTDKTIVEAFIHKTTVRDIDMLRSRIFTPEYGMENHFFYTCAGCGTKNRVPIELNANFFTAS